MSTCPLAQCSWGLTKHSLPHLKLIQQYSSVDSRIDLCPYTKSGLAKGLRDR